MTCGQGSLDCINNPSFLLYLIYIVPELPLVSVVCLSCLSETKNPRTFSCSFNIVKTFLLSRLYAGYKYWQSQIVWYTCDTHVYTKQFVTAKICILHNVLTGDNSLKSYLRY